MKFFQPLQVFLGRVCQIAVHNDFLVHRVQRLGVVAFAVFVDNGQRLRSSKEKAVVLNSVF